MKAFPPSKEVRKEERREEEQEGIEMERVELPAWENANIIKYKRN